MKLEARCLKRKTNSYARKRDVGTTYVFKLAMIVAVAKLLVVFMVFIREVLALCSDGIIRFRRYIRFGVKAIEQYSCNSHKCCAKCYNEFR